MTLPVSFNVLDRYQTRARWGLIGGSVLSLIGFLTPWFSPSDRWWYEGERILNYGTMGDGVISFTFIFILYAILLLLTFTPLGRSGKTATLMVFIAALLVMSTLIVVMLATADAIGQVGHMDNLQWSFGLEIMLVGHAIMISSAFSAWFLHILRNLVSTESKAFPNSNN
jgi:hypothetical protein